MTTLVVTIPQLQFIIDQCVITLEFGDWFEGQEYIKSDTTKHLLKVITLLNECVTIKENL